MKYLLKGELAQLATVVEYLQNDFSARGTDYLTFDAKVYDANGDHLGTVQITESGEYGFVLDGERDE